MHIDNGDGKVLDYWLQRVIIMYSCHANQMQCILLLVLQETVSGHILVRIVQAQHSIILYIH